MATWMTTVVGVVGAVGGGSIIHAILGDGHILRRHPPRRRPGRAAGHGHHQLAADPGRGRLIRPGRPDPAHPAFHALSPSVAIRAPCASVSRVSIFPTSARSTVRAAVRRRQHPGQQRRERRTPRRDVLRLRQRLPHDAAAPQRQPSGDLRVLLDGGPHVLHDERAVPQVLQHALDHGPRLRIQVPGRLAVEVGGEGVADVGLDQRFQPAGGLGVLVEGVHRRGERLHRLGRVRAEFGQPVPDPPEVVELRRRHARDLRLAVQRRGQPGVGGQALERCELPVGDQPQEVGDGCLIGHGGRRRSHSGSLSRRVSGAAGDVQSHGRVHCV